VAEVRGLAVMLANDYSLRERTGTPGALQTLDATAWEV
jgi:hypothetical protein